MIKIDLTDDQIEFLHHMGHIILDGKDTWVHMPYWIKCNNGDNEYHVVSYDEIPESLKSEIKKRRDAIANIPEELKNRLPTIDESFTPDEL